MINVFPDAMLGMWMEPLSPTTPRVERRLYVRPTMPTGTRRQIVDAHRLLHDQDIAICVKVQRSHGAGLDANGRLATFEERGVFFVHEQLRQALTTGDA